MNRIIFALLLCSTPAYAQTSAQIQDALNHLQAALADLQPPPATPTGKVSTLSATGDLQAALNAANCGDTILLPTNGVYAGTFTMSKICPSANVTLMSAGMSLTGRIQQATLLPQLRGQSGAASTLILNGTGITVRGLDIQGGNNTVDVEGSAITIDQSNIHGEDAVDHVRGINLNGDHVNVTNSIIQNFHAAGQDSQAVLMWNGTGPYLIDNNYLEAASEVILSGGADPTTPIVPSNITITRNYITKRLAWRTVTGWNVKNAIELKNASNVVISANTVENVWSDAQAGYLLVLTVRDQDGKCPQCTVWNVQVTGNVFRHGGGFANILAVDNDPSAAAPYLSVRAGQLTISGNLVYDIDSGKWKGAADASGRILQVLNGPNGLVVDHNTIVPGQYVNSLMDFDNDAAAGTNLASPFTFTNNVAPEGDYGILGQGDLLGIGVAILNHYAPSATWNGNTVIVGGGNGGYSYPAGTVVSAAGQVVVNPDFTLAPGFAGGANIAQLKASITGLDLTK